jgi:chaperonin cofactor prefoldin
LDELKIKIEPYEEKMKRFEDQNSAKNSEIQSMKQKLDKMDIGNNEDVQILKQKVNIVVSYRL